MVSILLFPSPMRLAITCLLVLLASPAAGAPSDALAAEFRDWLSEYELLITDDERDYFLGLAQDYRRRAFIAEWWRQRDPYPRTHTNELKVRWEERHQMIDDELGAYDDRARVLLLNDEPLFRCRHQTHELEIWAYEGNEHTLEPIVMVFWVDIVGPREYQIYRPGGRFERRRRAKLLKLGLGERCEEDSILAALGNVSRIPFYEVVLQDYLRAPEAPSGEWLATFRARSTELPEGAETFPIELAFAFPGRHQSRTVVQGVVQVPLDAVADGIAGAEYPFLLTGEVIRDDEIFETFRYRFERPLTTEATYLPLVFQRYLRPGEVTVIVKLEDLLGRRYAHAERQLTVPDIEKRADVPGLMDSELFRLLAEADEATARGERQIRIVPPTGVIHSGLVRFSTISVGEFEQVTFALDGKTILTKRRPPYSVELDLGEVPALHTLRVHAYDAAGGEVATDEVLLNPGGQRFRVRIIEPEPAKTYRGSLRAVVDVVVPDGKELDRLELFLDEERLATLFQPPFVQPIALDGPGLAYLRAVAHLADGNTSEEVVFINAPGVQEEIRVELVELYASVVDRKGRPILGLEKGRFKVFEDDRRQHVRRFEYVRGLPIHAGLLIDTSSSMEHSLDHVADAARAFLEQAIQPKDRATVITFDSQPRVEEGFSNDVRRLSGALETMRAEGSTALYDSLVFALHYFDGVRGQKALLLLSDGRDEASSFTVDGALDFARRAGVTIYTIGLESSGLTWDAKKVLRQLAGETGGRSFFVDDSSELAAIYASIQDELRSQYLLAYQSTSDKDPSQFRQIRVEAAVDGAEVRTLSGYYP